MKASDISLSLLKVLIFSVSKNTPTGGFMPEKILLWHKMNIKKPPVKFH